MSIVALETCRGTQQIRGQQYIKKMEHVILMCTSRQLQTVSR